MGFSISRFDGKDIDTREGNILTISQFFIDRALCWELIFLNLYITHVMAMSSTCYNPFLYGWMNPAFKTEFAKLCSCFLNTATAKQDSDKSVSNVSEINQ